jgi:hypothetical protein
MPSLDLILRLSDVKSLLSNIIFPPSGDRKPAIILNNVVLPLPLGPRRPLTLLLKNSILISFKACLVLKLLLI